MGKLFTQRMFLIMGFLGLVAGQTYAQVGTWTPLTNQSPDPNNGVMLLMTDGTVICHTTSGGNLGDGTIFDRLTPDSTGSYINGIWSTISPMITERYSFSSAVLKDGRIYAAGGEYGTDGTQNGYHGEVYDPTTDTWTAALGTNSTNVMSDGNCKLIDNGKVIQALVDVPNPVHTVVYTPGTNTYTTGVPTLNGQNESMWLKLPDNSILFVDEQLQTSERYIPAQNLWIADGNVPVSLYDPWGAECGPAWMLPNGKAFFMGGTNTSAYYTPSGSTTPGTWATGPAPPNGYSMPDAPGAMMPNGKILFACSPQPTQNTEFASPTKFYEFDYTNGNGTYTSVPAPSSAATGAISQQYNMVVLPNGQILLGMDQDNSSNQYYIYTPVGAPVAIGKPTIGQVHKLTCNTCMITGHGFNGISEGSAFGDENENDSNYPIFQFKQGGRVYYARSYNWNSTGVQRGNKADTAYFELPATMGEGSYYLRAIANGIASDSIVFIDSVASLSSPLANSVCSGSAFTYVPASSTGGATYTWTRAAVTGISNGAITTPQSSNPNEVLVNTTSAPVTVIYAYNVTGGGCTNQVNVSVVVNPAPTAGFTAFPTSGCVLPDSVSFTNTSVAGSTYLWYFGDGSTSAATGPVHQYTTGGTYSVKLVVRGCGADSITRSNYISLNPPSAPSATSPVNASCGGRATLTASGTDTLKWFNQATGGTQLGTGTSYLTPVLTSSTTYYVESYVAGTPSFCPPATDVFGTGGDYTNSNFRSNIFNVNQPCTLVSVVVYSTRSGNRTIQMQDANGIVLQSTTVNIPNGTSTVTLNYPLTVGTGYQLGCGDGSTTLNTNLYRNITGSSYPYSDPAGYVTITGNNVPDLTHYYFFYDWKLEGPACVSARTPVNVVVPTGGVTITPHSTEPACYGYTNGSASVTVTGGTGITYNWGGGNTSNTLSGVGAGTYTVTVSSTGGCSDTAHVTVGQPAQVSVNATVTPVACSGHTDGSIIASGSGGTPGYTYSWTGSLTGDTISGLTTGTYNVTATDGHSCTGTNSFPVTQLNPVSATVAVTNPTTNGGTGSASINGETGGTSPYTANWSSGTSGNSVSGLVPGTYTVTITDSRGCDQIDTFTVTKYNGVSNISPDISFAVYPNPARTEVVVDMQNNFSEAGISLKDLLGQTLVSIVAKSPKTTLQLSPFTEGVYFVEVQQAGRVATRKLIISR
jgi:hypothetical protein